MDTKRQIKPADRGQYRLDGEYHESTAQGALIAQ
jgi:hypothetical protein